MTHAPLTALKLLATSVLALTAAHAGAACYTVYDAAGRVVQRADTPPAQAAQASPVPEGGRVVLNGELCGGQTVGVAEQVLPAREPASAPLLTNVRTAAAAQAPYAVVGRDIAVVAPANAEQVWRRAPIVHNVVPASPRHATETVITEWADGRTDVEQRPAQPRR